MGVRSSRGNTQDLSNIPKNLLLQLAFPQVSEKFQKAEFFYKTRQMKIHIPVDNQKVIKQWDQNIHLFHANQMKYYILLPKSYEFQKQSYCGSAGIAKIIYDYFPYSLQGQIQNRKKSLDNQQFTEPQIWKILYTLLKASNLMHANWRKIGDIRPKNIFYNEQKQLRISCQYSYPGQLTNYEKFIFQKQPTYLAPQELHDIKMGRIDPGTTRNAKQHAIQAQSWSIGLTILHVVLLFNFQKIYDVFNGQINHDLLKQKITDLQNKKNISTGLKNIIKGMIQQIPERRLLSQEILLNYLDQYAQNIQNLKPFNTMKLNSSIKELMQKKSLGSLIGTVWEACNTGLFESLVINNIKTQRNQAQNLAKQAFMEELQKYSEIPPKASQVSMRESIRLGGSRRKFTQSIVQRKQSQASNQSFHTINSLRGSKQSAGFQTTNRISNFSLQNRFGALRLPTSGENLSPLKTHNFDNVSQKFMTPMEQSSYFQTIHGNQRSFDFNNFALFNSTFRNSQAVEEKNFSKKIEDKGKMNQKQANQKAQQFPQPKILIERNFKKQKSKQKK